MKRVVDVQYQFCHFKDISALFALDALCAHRSC